MTPDQQFWWNWVVSVATAVGTISAVVVALFLALRRPKPSLNLKLLRPEGERTHLNSGELVRYYHLHVWNERRSCPADEVQVFLRRMEEPTSANEPWQGDVPFRWRDQESIPKTLRIGTGRDCDLCIVGRDSGLRLMPLFTPNSLKAHRLGACVLVLFVQARSNQVDSELQRIQISWDGMWDDEDEKMRKHLVIT
jgi:hypothetical protein